MGVELHEPLMVRANAILSNVTEAKIDHPNVPQSNLKNRNQLNYKIYLYLPGQRIMGATKRQAERVISDFDIM